MASAAGVVTVGDGAFVVGGVMLSSSFIGETVGFRVSCFGGGGGTGTAGAALAGVVAGAAGFAGSATGAGVGLGSGGFAVC